VSITEEFLRDHYDRMPCMPGSLVIEAMVQLTAWCAIAKHDYKLSCVLSMLDDVTVPADLRPGSTLHITGELLGTNPKGSFAKTTASVDGVEVARIGRVLYAHVPMPDPEILRERLRYFGGTP
jgi:3-hydroxyacyl-[acyl-carrier-protein] dehydratase